MLPTFFPHYAVIYEPLYALSGKELNLCELSKPHVTYEQLRYTLSTAPALSLPDYSQSFELYTDASSCGIGPAL